MSLTGTLYFDAARRTLVRLDRNPMDLVRALARPVGSGPIFVVGATFDRTVFKYNVRSYRYVALDTGHVVANLLLAAHALGWRCRLEPWFDDARAASALGLDPENEGVVLVIPCDGDETPSPAMLGDPPELPERADEEELTRISHRLTSMRIGEDGARPVGVEPRAPGAEKPTVALPRPETATGDVFEVIRRRRSYRAFAAREVSQSQLAGVLADALAPSTAWAGDPLDLFVVVRAVQGVEPGVYRYARDPHGLVRVGAGDRSADIQTAGLGQELLGLAAFVLVWTYREDRVGSLSGARDYRLANLAAGIGGQVAYLSATALGLGICGVGAFYDGEVAEILRSNESRHQALYLMGVGARD